MTGAPYARLHDKILGSLAGAVIGDALGAPTEQRSRAEIHAMYGGPVTRFLDPEDDAPYVRGRRAARMTDDASQLLMLAETFADGAGEITARTTADMLIAWSRHPEYAGFAGPSTRRAIEALLAGEDPERTGARGNRTNQGTSNGAAMRVAPAGLVHPGDPAAAVAAAEITCRPSHHTSIGVAAAGAVAAAVAAALPDDASLLDVARAGLWGAGEGERLGAERGRAVAGPSVRARAERALEIAITSPDLDTAVVRIAAQVGTGLHAAEAAPAALGIFVAAAGDPLAAVAAAAGAGDDTDTVACMAGSIAGAYAGFGRVPADLYEQVCRANDLDLPALAGRLTAVAHPGNVAGGPSPVPPGP